ncbi:MAG: PIN domain-containing protein [Bacteroidales bacterium]|nr:PIN domain-containing protein [Bacteroidales bacterium]
MRERVVSVGVENCFVSEITLAELYYGASKSGREKHFRDVDFIASHFLVLPIRPILDVFGEIRYQLEKRGNSLDDFDLLIGCTALKNNFIVVTHNVNHLSRIPNVEIEDWQENF